jgi:hypothetical protein
MEKHLLSKELAIANEHLHDFGCREQQREQIIREKDEEIDRLQKELKDSELIREQLKSQIESLRDQLKSEIRQRENEKAKLKEMEEVIGVCKDQLESFDNINLISRQVIENLERQVGEYKYELE